MAVEEFLAKLPPEDTKTNFDNFLKNPKSSKSPWCLEILLRFLLQYRRRHLELYLFT
jgi:hypothetical protein